MKLECPQCQARYAIDDAIVPPQGAKIRCRKCGAVIAVPPAGAEPAVTSPAAPAAEPVPAPTETPVVPPSPAPEPEPQEPAMHRPFTPSGRVTVTPAPAARAGGALSPPHARPGFSFVEGENAAVAPPSSGPDAPPPAPAQPAMPPPPPAASTPVATPPPAEAPSPPSPGGSGIPAGLSPGEKARHEKARRLARVLASDMAIYNREKKERGLAEGNLVAVLGYEIKKSWEIYKERVGADFANATPYFRNALNDLLAEGRKIF